MSIWNDVLLHDYCNRCNLVAPYEPANVNPASIDLRLGTSYRLPRYTRAEYALMGPVEPADMWGDELQMPPEGIVLQPGQFILCCSLETVLIPADASAHLYSKSSTGRMGIEHLHAGLGDPAFAGQWTFELHNVAPWCNRLVPGKRYMQMEVVDMTAPPERDYSQTGRYQHQVGATPAREAR